MKRAFTGLLFGVALFSASATHHYPPTAESHSNTVTVTVVWLPDFASVDSFCAYLSGAEPKGNILGCFNPATQTIYAVQPRNFNDTSRLSILGHEFWHALGAEHP